MGRSFPVTFAVLSAAVLTAPWSAAAQSSSDEALIVAGSGGNIPAIRKIADAYRKAHPGVSIEVPDSLGSTGGIKATAAGAIDLGLSSRLPDKAELAYGLSFVPYAKVALVFGAHPTVPETNLSDQDLIDIYRGTKTRWSNGREIVVLMRDSDDMKNRLVVSYLPALGPLLEEASRTGRWQILFHDHEMIEALLRHPYSLGPTDLGSVQSARGPLKALALNGVIPTAENVRHLRYPLVLTQYLVHKGPLKGLAKDFVAFVRSAASREILSSSGYVPAE